MHNSIKIEQRSMLHAQYKQSYPGSVTSCNTWPGNEGSLFHISKTHMGHSSLTNETQLT